MSAQRLSDRKIRTIQRAVGESAVVLRGWSHGGYSFPFVTTEHHHGSYNTKTGAVTWLAPGERPWCYTSCAELPAVRPGPPA